jgi:hypothetical protein
MSARLGIRNLEMTHLLQHWHGNALHTESVAVERLRFIKRIRGHREVYVSDSGQHDEQIQR